MKAINKNFWSTLIIAAIILIVLIFNWDSLFGRERAPIIGVPGLPTNTERAERDSYGVSAGNPLAVEIGMKVLKDGGNAIDAAIAVSYALGVVQPYGSGIGGGGSMLIYPTDGQPPIFYDYLCTSPLDGTKPSDYIGVPGFVLGMEQLAKQFGTVPIGDLIEPSVQLAEKGFRVDPILAKIISGAKNKLQQSGASVFYNNGALPKNGSVLKQPALAETLRFLQKEGADAFYKGTFAAKIAASTQGLQLADLSVYEVIKREPALGHYKQWEVLSAPPPFSGVTLIQILEMSELLGVEEYATRSESLFRLFQIIKTAYRDRVTNIADPSFQLIDTQALVNTSHINQLIVNINSVEPFISSEIEDTTHFVIIDRNGMMVSCTNSLSSWFGSGTYLEGFFLNNQLKNLNQNPQSINYWEPGKRPRTFMSPTIFAKEGKPFFGIGTPGGNRIPAVLSQILISIFGNGEDPQVAIDAKRFYISNDIFYSEELLAENMVKDLNANGIKTLEDGISINYGAVNCLYYDVSGKGILGGADQRRGGSWDSE